VHATDKPRLTVLCMQFHPSGVSYEQVALGEVKGPRTTKRKQFVRSRIEGQNAPARGRGTLEPECSCERSGDADGVSCDLWAGGGTFLLPLDAAPSLDFNGPAVVNIS
jgi:hypothetical protein